jgi:hypothetical protein
MFYKGIQFRSTLEADWAATMDSLDWYWQYEPIAVRLTKEGIAYLCDFYLPNQRVWCEVKGPHDERLEKTAAFYRALEPDPWDVTRPLVVILRAAGPGDAAVWEGVDSSHNIVITTCPECTNHGFMDYNGVWACRQGCRNGGENKFWTLSRDGISGALYWPGELAFFRAPRPLRGGDR